MASAGEPRVLEHIEQHVTHLVLLCHRPRRAVRSANLPLHYTISHLLQANDVLYHRGEIDINSGRQISGCASIAAEWARDLVEPVDLRQNPFDVVVEHL